MWEQYKTVFLYMKGTLVGVTNEQFISVIVSDIAE
jgi:hypothetical protein